MNIIVGINDTQYIVEFYGPDRKFERQYISFKHQKKLFKIGTVDSKFIASGAASKCDAEANAVYAICNQIQTIANMIKKAYA